MKKLLLCCLLLTGCEQHFSGKVTITSRDGKLEQLEIQFPEDTTVKTKEDADKLVQTLESFIELIESAKERALLGKK